MGGTQLARLAGLLADGTRATFCLALLDGRAWTAGELAKEAGVAPSTASAHISQLVDGGLLTEERQGRHRYVRLADASVAQLIEDLAAHTAPGVTGPRNLREAGRADAMARARTCYDHLAGRLGVAITDAMLEAGWLQQSTGFSVTQQGMTWFREKLGVDMTPGRRPLARSCLDWTERRPHLAGMVGAGLCSQVLSRSWAVRIGSGRALRVTPAGQEALLELLGVEIS